MAVAKENMIATSMPGAHYQQSEEQLAPSLCSSPRSSHMEEELDALTASERQQLLDERDEALEQLRRLTLSRNDLARQQGQYKGRIAKLEGAISSGEKRLQGLAKELALYKERCEELLAERDTLLSQVGVTPERCRTERATLQAKTKKYIKLVYDAEARIRQQAGIAEHQATQQKEMSIFASLEHKAAAEALSSATTQCASLEAKLQEQTAVLDKTKEDAVSGQCRLQACEAEVRRLSEAHAPCMGALAKAEQELRTLRQNCQQLTQDRMQAVANIRKAEAEVDLIHQANEQMFRYLNYVRSRMNAHLDELQHTPDLLLLLRDLHAWCARESQGRGLVTPSRGAISKTPGLTPAPRSLASRTPVSCRR